MNSNKIVVYLCVALLTIIISRILDPLLGTVPAWMIALSISYYIILFYIHRFNQKESQSIPVLNCDDEHDDELDIDDDHYKMKEKVYKKSSKLGPWNHMKKNRKK